MKRRDFLALSASAAAAGVFAAPARANVPVPYDWTAMPPLGDKQAYIDWMVKTRGEDPKFLGERYDRFIFDKQDPRSGKHKHPPPEQRPTV